MRTFADDQLRAEMDKPLNWRDRLSLASDPTTADLGRLDATEAVEALEYIEKLEGALEEIACRYVTEGPLWWQQKAREALQQ